MSSDDQQSQFPRLAISDLIVLTLCIAFTLASIAPNYQEAIRNRDLTAWDVAPDLMGYLAIGISLFGLVVLTRQLIRRTIYPLSPGHWILIATGPYSVLALAALWVRPLLWAYIPGGWSVTQPFDCAVFILILCVSIAVTLPGMRVLEWRWRICLLLIHLWLTAMAFWLALDAARVMGYAPNSPWRQHLIAISSSCEILAAVAAAVALVIDAAKRNRRDWLHYLIVVGFVVGATEVTITWGLVTVRWWRELFYHLMS